MRELLRFLGIMSFSTGIAVFLGGIVTRGPIPSEELAQAVFFARQTHAHAVTLVFMVGGLGLAALPKLMKD